MLLIKSKFPHSISEEVFDPDSASDKDKINKSVMIRSQSYNVIRHEQTKNQWVVWCD